MIKAVFIDIDGTLVSVNTHRISDIVIEALYKAKDNGVKLFICSGRPIHLINNLRGFPFDGIITMNGALVYMNGETIDRHPIKKNEAIELATICERENISLYAATEKTDRINFYNDRAKDIYRLLNLPHTQEADIIKLANEEPIYQFTVFATKEEEKKFFSKTIKDACYPRWHPMFTDMIHKDVSKGKALENVCSILGISIEDSMAIGDGGNDISMLQKAGIGVAMGNAVDEVKAEADFVTRSVDEDGIAYALENYEVI